jgi:hypothetical protein
MGVIYTTPKSCQKKKVYNTMREAEKVIDTWPTRRNKHVDTLNAYHCNICNKFHIGHKYKKCDHKFQALIDRLMQNVHEGVC